MPLVIVTGLPTSGKSTRARQLQAYLAARIEATTPTGTAPRYRLHFISDQSLSIDRAVYDLAALPAHARSANASEKDARAAIYAAVKRVLSDRDIVVLDGLNYIKGWRYQLHCEAKAVRTTSCILQVGCARDTARALNDARLLRRNTTSHPQTNADPPQTDTVPATDTPPEIDTDTDTARDDRDQNEQDEAPYAPANWDNLVFRYEEPNPMTRWDSPLFTLIWDDDAQRARHVFDALWDAIAGDARKIVRPNQATVQRTRDADGDYLYTLDRETQDVVKHILDHQPDEGGGDVAIPNEGADDLLVELPSNKVGLPQLQRLRRAFVALNRGGIGLEGVGNMGPRSIRQTFVRYLNDNFERDT